MNNLWEFSRYGASRSALCDASRLKKLERVVEKNRIIRRIRGCKENAGVCGPAIWRRSGRRNTLVRNSHTPEGDYLISCFMFHINLEK